MNNIRTRGSEKINFNMAVLRKAKKATSPNTVFVKVGDEAPLWALEVYRETVKVTEKTRGR